MNFKKTFITNISSANLQIIIVVQIDDIKMTIKKTNIRNNRPIQLKIRLFFVFLRTYL